MTKPKKEWRIEFEFTMPELIGVIALVVFVLGSVAFIIVELLHGS